MYINKIIFIKIIKYKTLIYFLMYNAKITKQLRIIYDFQLTNYHILL